ncbi:MAG: class I SAM-dependent methyltransferase [Deltaproteobacteria bacterium]|nr:class I SAM-dependent methyltransferase [Deltaproteobacteria bacterium]
MKYSSQDKSIMRLLTKTYGRTQRWISLRHDFRDAKRRLLSSTDLTNDEKNILKNVSLKVHAADTMYVGNAFHYLSVGLSACRCIREVLGRFPKKHTVDSVLDFPSGYGRVLRFLRIMFANSDITAADIDSTALNFCGHSFSVTTLPSKKTLTDMSLHRRFDLIWCGSLFTHIDEQAARNLLQLFHDHLSDTGICMFTTHGQSSIDWVLGKQLTYGLTEDAQQKIIQEFQSNGYGYADYPNSSEYGISMVSHQRMRELAERIGRWKETAFLEHAWDNHHDVYAFAMQMPHRVNPGRSS